MKRFFTLMVVLGIVGMSYGQSMLIDQVRSTQNEDQTELVQGKSGQTNTVQEKTQQTNAAGPDLTASIQGFLAMYYVVPLEQAVIELDALIGNIGDELTAETYANVTVADVSWDVGIPVPLGTGEEVELTFPPYTATAEEELTFVLTAEADDDADPDNGVDIKNILVDSEVLSRNNHVYASNMSIGSPGGILGMTFDVLQEDVLSGVTFYLATATPGDIHQVVVYEFDGTPTNLIATAMDVLITEQNTYYTATFAEELTLSPGTYYVGIIEGPNAMRLGVSTDDYPPMTSWVYFNGAWSPVEDYNFFQVYMMDLEFGEWEAPLFDIAMEEITMPSYMEPGNVDVSGVIRNLSGEELTSIDISYELDGAEPVTQTFNVSVDPLGSYNFTFDNPVSLTNIGAYEFDIYLSNPNGMEDENPENDMINHVVNVVDIIPVKRVVGEEATGTWCGWCPRGAVFMDFMAEEYPDTWIGIAVHNGDPMVDEEYDDGIGPLIPGYPSGLVDRGDATDPSQFEDAYEERIGEIPPANISLEGVMLDGNELSFNVRADFVAQVSNFRFNAVIVESNVTGSTSGYNQANYYSGGGNGPMGGYEDMPNPVPHDQMVYHFVGRKILGGWNGSPGSLPETVYPGQSYWYNYSVTLQSDWDVNEINIVGMLINTETGMIENAVESNDNTVGIFDNHYNEANFSVYPNPAVDFMTIDAPEADRIEVINFMGQVVRVLEGTGRPIQISVTDFDAGFYFVKVTEGDRVSTKKVVVK